MAKFAASAVLDGALDIVATGTEMYLCSSQPATRAAAITAAAAPAIVLDSGDFSKSSSGSNRVLTVSSQSATADAAITVNHVAICTGSTLLYVTTCAAQTTNIGAPVTVTSFTVTMEQPV
jgi:hypothetical protein